MSDGSTDKVRGSGLHSLSSCCKLKLMRDAGAERRDHQSPVPRGECLPLSVILTADCPGPVHSHTEEDIPPPGRDQPPLG